MNLWQIIFLAASAAFIALEVIRGAVNGLVRQAAQLVALGAAWWCGTRGAQVAAPHLAPLGLPDFLLPYVAGLGIGILTFALLAGLGSILFKRTTEQKSLVVQTLYGVGGAVLGLAWAMILIWISVVGVRLLGTVAEVELAEQQRAPASHSGAIVRGLAQAKGVIEQDPVGVVVKQVDPVPGKAYELLSRITRMVSSQERVERFLSFPAAVEIAGHPMIQTLREDPVVANHLLNRNYLALIRHPALVEAANDPGVRALVEKFDLPAALEYALQPDQTPAQDPPEPATP